MSNLGKSLLGLVVYAPLAATNALADFVARKTEPWCAWFEKDLPADPDPNDDGDDTDDIVTEPDYVADRCARFSAEQRAGIADFEMRPFLEALRKTPVRNPENI